MVLRNLLTGVCAGAMMVTAIPTCAQTLEDAFRTPAKDARPRLRWWWPGAAVDDAELRREVALLDDNGFGGAEIQSFTPNFVTLTPAERAVVNDYAEPDFFAHVRAAADAAKAHGLTLDYTLGSAWPSGGGFAIPPEKAFVELTMARTQVAGGASGPIKVNIPPRTKRLGALSMFDPRVKDPRVADWASRMEARAKIVAVVAVKGTAPELKSTGTTMGIQTYPWGDVIRSGLLVENTHVILTDRMRADGTLDWAPPPGTWQVFVFKQYASNMGVLGAAGQGPQLILDHMNPAAFAAHVGRVGDPLGKNPAGIRATFVDSLELMQDLPWGEQFLAEFRKRRGYDVTPYLPLVLQPGWMQAWGEHWSPPYFEAANDTAERVRSDYRRTVSDLMFAGFIDPYVAWNHAHGLKAKFQAHGGAIDIVRGYGVVDIPETEDLVHEGDPYFMRFARSGADLYGRSIVSAESLVWKDRPYDVTPDELRRRADLIFSGGVNAMIWHGLDYRFHADDWPGWHAFQPSPFALGFSTMFAETNPIWAAVKPLATYVGRMQAVLQAGHPIVPVAYFYGQTGYYVGIEDKGAGKQAAEKSFIAGGYDYDRINPDAISSARVVDRQLVAKGGARYAVLVLPPIDGMRADTAEAIARFAKAGLPVVFTDHAPVRDEGLSDAVARDARVRAAVAATLQAGAKIVPQATVVANLRAAAIPTNLRFTGADAGGLVFVQRRVGTRTVTFIHNLADAPRDAGLVLPGVGGVRRWNAVDGSITPVAAVVEGMGTRVPLTLEAGASALLVLDPATKPASIPATAVLQTVTLAGPGWSLAVEGHAARKPFAKEFGSVELADWRTMPELLSFSGKATYRRTFEVDAAWLTPGRHMMLDLGQVHDMATVTINGRVLPPVITAPFRVDLTAALHSGVNHLVVTVANVPNNAMIDTLAPGYKDLKPVPAGLVGPVTLVVER